MCLDRPTAGFATYSTIGLHEAPNLLDGKDIRVEVAGVADTAVVEFANLLATAAFYVIKDSWLCAPGVVFPGLVSDYGLPRRWNTFCGLRLLRGTSSEPST